MNTILPISINIILYLINFFLIIHVSRYIKNSYISRRPTLAIILLTYIIILIIFILCYIYFLKSILLSNIWFWTIFASFLSFIVFMFPCYFLFSSRPFSQLRYKGSNWRFLDLPKKRFFNILNAVRSPMFAFYMYLLLVVFPYVLRALILIIIGQRQESTFELQSFLILISSVVLFIPFLEESLFRWFPLHLFGIRGLAIGSVIWFFLHPIDRITTGISASLLISTIPVWIPQIIFYIKIWRSNYYWAGFFFHSLTNLLLLVSGYILNIS